MAKSKESNFIRENRRKYNVTQKELAKAMEVNHSYVSHIETGMRGMSPPYFLAVKSALETAIKIKTGETVNLKWK